MFNELSTLLRGVDPANADWLATLRIPVHSGHSSGACRATIPVDGARPALLGNYSRLAHSTSALPMPELAALRVDRA
jgi:hypothetical protein